MNMKKFDDFLNESVLKKIQYDIDKYQYDEFEYKLKNKAQDMGIDINISTVDGVSQIKVFIRLNGEKDVVDDFMNWVEFDLDKSDGSGPENEGFE